MHTRIRPAVVGGVAALAINALAPVAPAAPAPGGIPLRVIRNQLQYCSVICPSVVQATEAGLLDAVEVADDAAQTLARTGNVASAASVGVRGTADALNTAGRTVADSINTAAAHINSSLHDPFPSVKVRPATQPATSDRFASGPRNVDGVVRRALTAVHDAQPAVHDAQPDSSIRHRALTAHTSG